MPQEDRETRKQQFHENYGKLQARVIPADPALLVDVRDREEIVGPYCRVSTMSGEQVESYEMQKKYYTELIQKRPKWTLYRIYADEGISATSIKRRKDFRNLIADCHDHKLSLVVTKSVTRFARNVVDCISTCRELKSLNPQVGILFETENIHTLTQSSEIQLDIFAMLAQSESETKSVSVKWGIRNRFAANIPRVVAAYGYTKSETGQLIQINPEEAEVVVRIFLMFNAGFNTNEICDVLNHEGIPAPKDGRWYPATIGYILTNEKYIGDVANQKTLVVDCFEHTSVKNVGQLPKYYFDNIVSPIVQRDVWKQAQLYLLRTHWHEFLDMTRPPEVIDGTDFYPVLRFNHRII